MATVQKIPLGRKPGQAKVNLPDQVQVSLGELAGKVKQGLLAFSVGVGLEVFRTLLDEDVTTIVGERGKWNPDRSAHRHGAETSSITLGGRKVAVERPRVRSVADEEIALPTWGAFSGDDLLIFPLICARFEATWLTARSARLDVVHRHAPQP